MRLISAIILFSFSYAYGQEQTGFVLNAKDNKPVEYVNIGIIGKGIGTTSDTDGRFDIDIDNQYNNDSIRFSCIGFKPYTLKVSDFKQVKDLIIRLDEKIYDLNEVIISPRKYKLMILGYTTHTKAIQAGFEENLLGYECGVCLKVKKSAKLNKINLNVARCSYDTIFYRINIYKVISKMNFENVLTKPVYFTLSKDKIKDEISIDVSKENIQVDGDFLVTIEHIKGLGKGSLMFSGSFPGKVYYRKTSQANWETAPVGISLNVEANVEQ